MLDENSIFVAGMPRAGSMWTYNVVRRLIVLAGKTPWPEKVPTDERSIIEDVFSKPAGDGRVYCVKTHYAIVLDQPNIKILCNIRDIRDATLSFMRFMRCPFETALESARESMKITDHYLGVGNLSVLPIDYDDMLCTPSKVVAKIADFISVVASDAEVDGIVTLLSRERILTKLEKLGAVAVDPSGGIESRSDAGLYDSVKNMDGSYRVFDYETGFQSNHITSSREGEWREALNVEQKRVLNKLLGKWLHRYGFDI